MPDSPITLSAPAKINLFLKITGRRKDGYHNIATLFQMIDLCDRLTFSPNRKPGVKVSSSPKKIPQKENLVYKAAMALWKPGLPGVVIDVEKNIPAGAGLGGGSSDAATTLFALNEIWKLGIGRPRLMNIGARLGADIPFFLSAPRAWGTGIGNILRPLPKCETFHIVLVKPKVSVSTVSAYVQFSRKLTSKLKAIKMPLGFIDHTSFEDTLRFLQNDLEETVMRMHPVIASVKRFLQGHAGEGVMVTGSGSTVFALFRERYKAQTASESAREMGWWSVIAKPLEGMKHLETADFSRGF